MHRWKKLSSIPRGLWIGLSAKLYHFFHVKNVQGLKAIKTERVFSHLRTLLGCKHGCYDCESTNIRQCAIELTLIIQGQGRVFLVDKTSPQYRGG